ncbi:alpha/beta fold hydrolase [Curtobacterium ammoniigenes]|uniref:alpha/beta fold hydrolase n=1 Tax=Curtobacterium ammoniigenes TaxID=395387 RepID=UPI00083048DC|nr:alpha/beta hydrolase [Curtobacterium ammoniigenes]
MHPPIVSPHASQLARTPVVHRAATVDDRTTHYWEYGDPDATLRVLAVHGFRGDHHGLAAVAAYLPTMRVIVPDLPGFGLSDPLPDSDMDAYVGWLRAFADALGLGRDTIVLGHSFGSIVCAAAVADGLDTRLLVLVNPIAAPALQGPRAIGTRIAVGYYRAGAALPEPLGGGILRNRGIVRAMSIAMLKSKDPAMRRWVHDQHDRFFSAFANRRVVLEAFRASATHDVSEYADRIPVPTLLVAAERDDITAIPEQEALAARIPGSRLVVIPDVGHLVHYETPKAAADAVMDAVATLADPPTERDGAER